MEKLEIIITKESIITKEEFKEFIKIFNLLKNEEVKKQVMNLVKNLINIQNR